MPRSQRQDSTHITVQRLASCFLHPVNQAPRPLMASRDRSMAEINSVNIYAIPTTKNRNEVVLRGPGFNFTSIWSSFLQSTAIHPFPQAAVWDGSDLARHEAGIYPEAGAGAWYSL